VAIEHAILRSLAARAGEETGETYPSAGRWIKRFVELVEEYLREHAPGLHVPDQIQEALAFYARRENWQRDVVMTGKRCSGWKQAQAILDKGSMARLAMLQASGGAEEP
jgi:hypothetical protein